MKKNGYSAPLNRVVVLEIFFVLSTTVPALLLMLSPVPCAPCLDMLGSSPVLFILIS